MNKKKLIIIISIILVIGILVIGYIFKDKLFGSKEKKLSTTWGETYYVYLKDIKDNNKYKEAGLPDDLKVAKVNFISAGDIKDPVMTITYDKDKKEYTNIYYINNDKVDAIVYNEPTSIELLYNIEKDSYNYYSNTVSDSDNYYKNVTDQIKSKTNKDSSKAVIVEEYIINSNDKEEVTDSSGNSISLTKFESTFIKVDTPDNSFEFNKSIVEDELRKLVDKSTNLYEDIAKTIKANKENVERLKNELKEKEERIKSIKEEKSKEEVKETNNDTSTKEVTSSDNTEVSGIKLGSYTINYGTYVGEAASSGITLVLNKDGSCTYDGNPCTYSVGTHDFAQDESTRGSIKTCLIINADYTTYLYPYSSTAIGDGDINTFNYQG